MQTPSNIFKFYKKEKEKKRRRMRQSLSGGWKQGRSPGESEGGGGGGGDKWKIAKNEKTNTSWKRSVVKQMLKHPRQQHRVLLH